MDADLLHEIFLDAHVLDLDFSRWDRSVKILVVATEMPPDGDGHLPVFIVDFLGVEEFTVRFSHLDRPLDEGHYQWRADSFDLSMRGARYIWRSLGRSNFP